ncbi:MAG: DNA-binding response regulator [Acidobacteria bacterium]|nr:MAG: DNA-binding response regulator [Acidobacteriota bacterium]
MAFQDMLEPIGKRCMEPREEASRGTGADVRLIRIVIADQHAISRDGLRRLLETRTDFRIVGEACEPSHVLAIVRRVAPDVLLFDAGHPAVFDILARVVAIQPPVRSILLTGSMRAAEATRALQLGACGILPTDSPPSALFESIESVMAGQYWIGVERASDIEASVRRLEVARRRARAFGLTRRELEILRALTNGDTNRTIATNCAISENTVKHHIKHIFDKVGASNRVELAMFAAYHQLTDIL